MRVKLYFNTLKYLKLKQILYRLFYRVRDRFFPLKLKEFRVNSYELELIESISNYSKVKDREFYILNRSKEFKEGIDWDFLEYGKLWCYNLNYFEYLDSLDRESGVKLILEFIDSKEKKIGLEAFPISLRGINWIKFLSRYRVKNQKISNSLYSQYQILSKSIEYHILGNHLLENGFSLLFGSYYFQDEKLYNLAKNILIKELKEQILRDGAHFELSPTYHQLMLFRVLDSINLVKNSDFKSKELLKFLEDRAKPMLNWIESISFRGGEIPLFNDSSNSVAPTTKSLIEYAKRLGIDFRDREYRVFESGYWSYKFREYQIAIDMANIEATYIAGHTHSDIFTFELYSKNRAIIVDRGVSTYESSSQRLLERSIKSHNSVEIEDFEPIEIWSSFRVGERGYISDFKESRDSLSSSYNFKGITQSREFKFYEDAIEIFDRVSIESKKCYFRLHFAPELRVELKDEKLYVEDIKFHFENYSFIYLESYEYAKGFNSLERADLVVVEFRESLKTRIEF